MPLRVRSAARRVVASVFGAEFAQRLAERLHGTVQTPPQNVPEKERSEPEPIKTPIAAYRARIERDIGRDGSSAGARDEFFLTEGDDVFDIAGALVRWAPAASRGAPYVGLALAPETTASTPILRFGNDTTLVCEIAVGSVDITFQAPGVTRALVHIAAPALVTVDLSVLDGLVGTVLIQAKTEAIVLKWIVARSDRVGLLHGRSHYAHRLATESQFFTEVYDHAIYKSRGISDVQEPFEMPKGRFRTGAERLPDADAIAAMPQAAVRPGDNAHLYALRLLEVLIGREIPDFARKLTDRPRSGPVRMLSLCSGTAGVERQILERAGVDAEITLVDINPTLMGRAASTLAPYARVSGIVGDVNELDPKQFDSAYDVVMCVSGLHHVVELERVLSASSTLLVPGGEFWLVGEQVGRNGNRLWPEVREAANRAFARLPRELRKHAADGAYDEAIREADFSSVSFEGIRSEEIEGLLSRYFEPVEVYRRNCFLWRILEPNYFANYDLEQVTHRRAIQGLVAAEYAIWRSGCRPTEAWGIYRRR